MKKRFYIANYIRVFSKCFRKATYSHKRRIFIGTANDLGISAELTPNECRIFDLVVLDALGKKFTARGLPEVLLIAENEISGHIGALRGKFPDDRYDFQTLTLSINPQIWGHQFVPRS